jgi:hypothetical protein
LINFFKKRKIRRKQLTQMTQISPKFESIPRKNQEIKTQQISKKLSNLGEIWDIWVTPVKINNNNNNNIFLSIYGTV